MSWRDRGAVKCSWNNTNIIQISFLIKLRWHWEGRGGRERESKGEKDMCMSVCLSTWSVQSFWKEFQGMELKWEWEKSIWMCVSANTLRYLPLSAPVGNERMLLQSSSPALNYLQGYPAVSRVSTPSSASCDRLHLASSTPACASFNCYEWRWSPVR